MDILKWVNSKFKTIANLKIDFCLSGIKSLYGYYSCMLITLNYKEKY